MTVAYHEDENAAVRQPREISHGNGGDAKLRFVYAARADTETATQGGAERIRHLLPHTVRAVLDGRAVREYRLLSETTSGGWWRLDKVQLCGHDEDGANPECLAALDPEHVVAKGNFVNKLVTVDPVSRRRPDFEAVAEHFGVWHNYDSISRKRFDRSNVVARVGGAWNDAPEGFADSHTEVDETHVEICRSHCAP